MRGGVVNSVLMCHAPIVIPRIAGAEADRVAASTQAMHEAARAVVDAKPDVVAVVSPHAPREPDGWLVGSDGEVAGDFGRFGAPGAGVSLPEAERAVARLERVAHELEVPCARRPLGDLDHGSLVPLWFVQEAGWGGPTVRIALPWSPDHGGCEAMGRAIARTAAADEARWAFVASGDMSHRLVPGAPAGYAPDAAEFDAQVRRCVETGEYAAVRDIDPALRSRAAEDVIDSLDVAYGAIDGDSTGHQVLSYEGPFGVGYLVAVLFDSSA